MNKHLEAAEKYAREYDQGASTQFYYGPELLFGLIYEYLKPNDKLLDIAIGTGLSSLPFIKAGVKIFGVDGAEEMLKICREKGLGEELKQADLLADPIPYPEDFFELAIANSLFHMIEDPGIIIRKAVRVLRNDAVLGFTFDEHKQGKMPEKKGMEYRETGKQGVLRAQHPESGMDIYRHSEAFIRDACVNAGLDILKATEFLTFQDKEGGSEFYFTAMIARKNLMLI